MVQITQMDNQWHLNGEVDVDTANIILKQSEQLTFLPEIIIDFGHVTYIDTAAISLILEWKRRATKNKSRLSIVNLPSNLISLAKLYGVADFIH